MGREESFDEEIIKDIMNHLDRETTQGTVRMSVNMDPEKKKKKQCPMNVAESMEKQHPK